MERDGVLNRVASQTYQRDSLASKSTAISLQYRKRKLQFRRTTTHDFARRHETSATIDTY